MRLLIVGLDGLDHRLVRMWNLWPRGALSEMRPTDACTTPIEWTCMATGLPPEKHGIVGMRAPGGRLWEHTDVVPGARAFWRIFERLDYRVGIIGWPVLTNPAHEVKGWMIGGYSVVPPTCWPLGLFDVGGVKPHWDENSWQEAGHPNPMLVWPPGAGDPLQAELDERAESMQAMSLATVDRAYGTLRALQRHDPVDVAVLYTHATDLPGHYLYCDRYRGMLRQVYRRALTWLDGLIDELKPEAWLVVSDHGMQRYRPWNNGRVPDAQPSHDGEHLQLRRLRMKDGRTQYAGATHGPYPAVPMGVAAASKPLPQRVHVTDVFDIALRLGMTPEDRLRSWGYE